MASVVFLKGANVGGQRTFRPKLLAEELSHLDPVNIGAAGTFVIRKRVAQTALRDEIAGRLPFEVQIMICTGHEILNAMEKHPFTNTVPGHDVVRFVSILARRPRSRPPIPMPIPAGGECFVRILAVEGRFVFGHYLRRTRSIGYLNEIEKVLGVGATTRNWNTITRIVGILNDRDSN